MPDKSSSQSYPQELPPPYPQKEEVTLFHSTLVGQHPGAPQSILLPPSLLLVRIWSGDALDGLEFFSTEADSYLLGSRGGSPFDFKLNTTHQPGNYGDEKMSQTEHIAKIEVRCGAWIDAIQITTSTGRQSGWRGGSGGGVEVFQGIIVGVLGEVDGYLKKFGVIYGSEYKDFRGYARDYNDEKGQGLAQSSKGNDAAQKPRFRWDTGRLTRGKGVGFRWNHERNRMEIYQGGGFYDK